MQHDDGAGAPPRARSRPVPGAEPGARPDALPRAGAQDAVVEVPEDTDGSFEDDIDRLSRATMISIWGNPYDA